MANVKANLITISFLEKTPNYQDPQGEYIETLREYPAYEFPDRGYLVEYENAYDAFYSYLYEFVDVNEFTEGVVFHEEFHEIVEWTKEEFQEIIDNHLQAYGDTVPPKILALVAD